MIEYIYLGRVSYGEGLLLQAEIAGLRAEGRVGNVLLLLEHPPVLTLGRNANRANVLATDELLAARGVKLNEINRGGDVTYHGPGQLVGYPIFDLRSLRNPNAGNDEQGPGTRGLGTKGLGTEGPGTEGLGTGNGSVGQERKIGAIGIHVAKGITSHGFAFNVTTDLRDFDLIVPCGIPDHAATSLERELALDCEAGRPEELPALEAVAHETARQFGLVFDERVLAVESLAALRAEAEAAAGIGPKFPAEDTPMRVPAEVERLRGVTEGPAQVC